MQHSLQFMLKTLGYSPLVQDACGKSIRAASLPSLNGSLPIKPVYRKEEIVVFSDFLRKGPHSTELRGGACQALIESRLR